MDLNRAKTILIIIFLFLNGLLFNQLYFKQFRDQDSLALIIEETEEVTSLLTSQNIGLGPAIPTSNPDMPFLRINRRDQDLGEIESKLEGEDEDVAISQISKQRLEYKCLKSDLAGNFGYNIDEAVKNYDKKSKNKEATLTDLFNNFISNKAYQGKNYRLSYNQISQVDQSGNLVFHYQAGGYPVFGTEIIAQVVNNRIVSWTQEIPPEIQVEESKRPILAAATVLRNLPNLLDERPLRINRIELAYYNRQPDEDMDMAEAWLLPPVWAVSFTNGQIVYFNALTGELEGLVEPETD